MLIKINKLCGFANFRCVLLPFCMIGGYVFSTAEGENIVETINDCMHQIRENAILCDSFISPSVILSQIMELFNLFAIKIGSLIFLEDSVAFGTELKEILSSFSILLTNIEEVIKKLKNLDIYFKEYIERDAVYTRENNIDDMISETDNFYKLIYSFFIGSHNSIGFNDFTKLDRSPLTDPKNSLILDEARSFFLMILVKTESLCNIIDKIRNITRAPSPALSGESFSSMQSFIGSRSSNSVGSLSEKSSEYSSDFGELPSRTPSSSSLV
jgi:hypothetical protein